MKQQKIGFFGGTFDPIHLGHINLAIQIAEIHKLDQLFFCPASQSPHKKEAPPIASKEHRRAMVAAAIAPIPYFTFLDFEIQKSDPCYTIDTLRQLIALDKTKKKQYHLILGDDCLENFSSWRECEELAALAPPLIGTRKGEALSSFKTLPKKLVPIFKKGMTEIHSMEISSTNIRERIQKNYIAGIYSLQESGSIFNNITYILSPLQSWAFERVKASGLRYF